LAAMAGPPSVSVRTVIGDAAGLAGALPAGGIVVAGPAALAAFGGSADAVARAAHRRGACLLVVR
ncbi:MAG: hypothetical protein RID91_09660, partial [Azospirillaceae bacterium]